jgi:hypothetical protein
VAHAPQWYGSLCVFAQNPPQSVHPLRQTQVPKLQY